MDFLKIFSFSNIIYNDAPEPWQLGFQDVASPAFTGIVELHNEIFFFLTVICVGVFFMLFSILIAFNSNKTKIIHKYLNHGTRYAREKSVFTFLKIDNSKKCLSSLNKNLVNRKFKNKRYYSTTTDKKISA